MGDPYQKGMFQTNPYAAKKDISSELVVILDGRYEGRGLSLITPMSRAVKKHEIHELIVSDEQGIGPKSTVNHIAYIGFVEMQSGGVIITGDEVLYNGKRIGVIAGFDETHMPNHLNIVMRSDERASGLEQGLDLGGSIVFKQI